jgi:hypothetical protein
MFCPNRECLDFEETGEPGEYRDDIEVCPKCGTRLVHERPEVSSVDDAAAEVGEDALPEEPLVAVASFNYRQDADLAISMLRANGVPAAVFNYRFGGDPRVDFGSRVRVMVSESDAGLAQELLEQEAREPEGEA